MNWIDDIVENVVSNYNGRKIVIWGYNSASKDITVALKSRNIETEFYIEERVDDIVGRVCRPYSEVCGKHSEYYLVIPLGIDDKRRQLLNGGVIFLIKITIIFVTVLLKKVKSILRMHMETRYMDITKA